MRDMGGKDYVVLRELTLGRVAGRRNGDGLGERRRLSRGLHFRWRRADRGRGDGWTFCVFFLAGGGEVRRVFVSLVALGMTVIPIFGFKYSLVGEH